MFNQIISGISLLVILFEFMSPVNGVVSISKKKLEFFFYNKSPETLN